MVATGQALPDLLGELAALPKTADPLAELKGRGRSGKREGEGREGEMEEEVKGRRNGKDPQMPQYLKCVDAHADLPIIKQLLTFWHSGALCTGVPETSKIDKK